MKKCTIAAACLLALAFAAGCGKSKESAVSAPVNASSEVAVVEKTVEPAPAKTEESASPAPANSPAVEEKKEPAPVKEQEEPASAKEQEDIGLEEAKRIALADAGKQESEVTFRKARLDTDDRFVHYDIEFVSGGWEYEYEIKVSTGEIIDIDKDYEGTREKEKAASSANYISKDEAVDIALKHAGLSRSDIKQLEAELDTDDSVRHYEIGFKSGGWEYEYEINAKTGKIMEHEKERD